MAENEPKPAPLTPSELSALERLEREATPGPWEWQTGCSWRRIGSAGESGNVLCPMNARYDNHPDLACREEDGEYIAALRNAAPRLLSELLALREENERLRRDLGRMCDNERLRMIRSSRQSCNAVNPNSASYPTLGDAFAHAAWLREHTRPESDPELEDPAEGEHAG